MAIARNRIALFAPWPSSVRASKVHGIAGPLLASRGDAAPVFPSVRDPDHALTERAVNYIVKEAAERAGVNPAASVHASHAIDNAAPITLFQATLGHADLKTTRVYADAAGRKLCPLSEGEMMLGANPKMN